VYANQNQFKPRQQQQHQQPANFIYSKNMGRDLQNAADRIFALGAAAAAAAAAATTAIRPAWSN